MREFSKIQKLCLLEDEHTHQNDKEAQIASSLNNPNSKCNLHWTVILEILTKYETQILPIIKSIFDKIPTNYINIINHTEMLQKIMELKIKTSRNELRERKMSVCSAKASISSIHAEIQELTDNINEENVNHNDMIEKFRDEIGHLNLVLQEIKTRHEEEFNCEIKLYKKVIHKSQENTAEEANYLNDQLAAHKVMLKKLIQSNLEQEKSLRAYSIKAEAKNLSARNNYDQDLNKLNELQETLEMQLHVTNNHYKILKNEYNVQSVLFLNLKKEREIAIMQAFAARLDNFEKNRAARIIQRTWRSYHQRISSKKKKRARKKNY